MAPPVALIIAGCNGAGKSTFAQAFLPLVGDPVFLNADLIASGLDPQRSDRAAVPAGKLLLTRMAALVEAGESFVVETTLSGRTYARHVGRWKQAGFRVELLFLRLGEAGTARERVARRVREGGHAIPPDVIDRRHRAGREQFAQTYQPLVDAWALYDADRQPPERVGANGPPPPGAVPFSILDHATVGAALERAREEARWRAAVHGHTLVYTGPGGGVVEVDPGPPYVKKRMG